MEHVIGIPISSTTDCGHSVKKCPMGLLPDSATQQIVSPTSSKQCYSTIKLRKVDSLIAKLGETLDIFAQGIWDHVKLAPKLTETVKGKLSLGAKILRSGGVEKIFRQSFEVRDGEKLLKASQCYLSTTAGPIAGLMFVSNSRIAFCSERSIKLSSPTGKLLKIHYKVMIPLRKIKGVDEIENVKKPKEKYVHMITEDNFDFWFLGFLNRQKTLNCLKQVMSLDQ